MRAYLDYNATTPVDPAVLEAMLPFLADNFGNASSIHSAGQRARAAVDRARDFVAALLGAKPSEIVFTSGGTESDNLAILGLASGVASKSVGGRKHIITSAIEHHAILNSCQALEKQGIELTYVPVGNTGVIDPDEIRRALRPETILISVMHTNNELGTIQPIEEIGRITAEADVYFHCDAVQSAGKLPLNVTQLGVDRPASPPTKFMAQRALALSTFRTGTPLAPQFHGGHHERDRRPGTENVPGIVGLGKAAELARANLATEPQRIAALRDRLERAILDTISSVRVCGDATRRAPNTTNLSFAAAGGEAMLIALDLLGVACSTGAACSSGALEPSHVLLAIGLSPDEARSSLRFSLGRQTTPEEIDYAISAIPEVVARLRALSPRSATMVTAQ